MDWKLCLLLFVTACFNDVRSQSLEELAKMAGIDLKDIAGDDLGKNFDAEESSPRPLGLRSLFGRVTGSSSSSSSSASTSTPSPLMPLMKSASSQSFSPSASAPMLGSNSPCGHCGNCPSCLLKHMRMMNSEFGGLPAGSEMGYPGMSGQLSQMGLGGDIDSLNSMSPFSAGVGPMAGAYGSPYGGSQSNFMPTDSYSPFMSSPSMLSGAGMTGGFENFPEPGSDHRYPLQEEEMPRPYPMARSRPRSRPRAPEPAQYEPEANAGPEEDGSGEENGPPAYDQSSQDQDGGQGYTGSPDSGAEEQHQGGYERQPDSEQQQYQDPESGGQAQQQRMGGRYQRSNYKRSHENYDK